WPGPTPAGPAARAASAACPRRAAPDAAARVEARAAEHGLRPAGRASFTGLGQGRSPRGTAADLRRGWFTQLPPGAPLTEDFAAALEALPDPDRRRPDPVFSLRAFHRPG
ncbi:SAM-dependent methyltransferase, partial [Streptomyces sp. NPDC003832]